MTPHSQHSAACPYFSFYFLLTLWWIAFNDDGHSLIFIKITRYSSSSRTWLLLIWMYECILNGTELSKKQDVCPNNSLLILNSHLYHSGSLLLSLHSFSTLCLANTSFLCLLSAPNYLCNLRQANNVILTFSWTNTISVSRAGCSVGGLSEEMWDHTSSEL